MPFSLLHPSPAKSRKQGYSFTRIRHSVQMRLVPFLLYMVVYRFHLLTNVQSRSTPSYFRMSHVKITADKDVQADAARALYDVIDTLGIHHAIFLCCSMGVIDAHGTWKSW